MSRSGCIGFRSPPDMQQWAFVQQRWIAVDRRVPIMVYTRKTPRRKLFTEST
ncbi:hypothetical protein ARMSODRAFT_1027582 [Armillaria solidipes]|uniref:Uncharacterized protein n=1 Tax=Armillaria solidipes TaxID=1076256 RepID=A0A2H3B862_9AGAR|nr:hypothetical protein ARMSODRAFT_1027582 [Armillaria solidipes]